MNIFNYLIFFTVCIASLVLAYKIRYHNRIKNKTGQSKIVFLINKSFYFSYLFPLRMLPNNSTDNKLRIKANISLSIFYLAFFIGLIPSLFAK